MEPTPCEFTPEQKDFLEALSRQTGEAVAVLIAKALEALQAHVRHEDASGAAPSTPKCPASVLDIFREAREAIPDETWDTLPSDLATQHDHYIYGTPKRPA